MYGWICNEIEHLILRQFCDIVPIVEPFWIDLQQIEVGTQAKTRNSIEQPWWGLVWDPIALLAIANMIWSGWGPWCVLKSPPNC